MNLLCVYAPADSLVPEYFNLKPLETVEDGIALQAIREVDFVSYALSGYRGYMIKGIVLNSVLTYVVETVIITFLTPWWDQKELQAKK